MTLTGSRKPTLVLIGLQGSGKGTQTEILVEKYHYRSIAVGQRLRDEVARGTALGAQITDYLDRGILVPDEMIIDVIRRELTNVDHDYPVIFDGFPRTMPQATLLDNLIAAEGRPLPTAIHLHIPVTLVYDRLTSRRTCQNCGKIVTTGGQTAGVNAETCPRCQGTLAVRPDDTPTVIEHRLAIFDRETKPVIRFYQERGRLFEVAGHLSIPEVTQAIENVVDLSA